MTPVIATLPVGRLDESKTLRLELQHHHGTLDLPAGFVPRPDGDAWTGWRRSTEALLRGGDAELFVHLPAPDEPPDGLALVTVVPASRLLRPILEPVGVHAELVTLVVAASARSGGVGAALYDTAADWARGRGASVLHIGTRSGNEDGLRFYARQGATPAFTTLLHRL